MTAYTQSTNLFATLNFAADGDTWTVAPDVTIAVSSSHAVQSIRNLSTLVNHGSIFSGNAIAVFLSGAGESVVNAADGEMVGFNSGIYLTGAGTKVTNAGVVKGLTSMGVLQTSSSTFEFHNTGKVYGNSSGAYMSSTQGGVFENKGLIESASGGATFGVSPGKVAQIINGVHGVIKGDLVGISMIGGAASLDNKGTIVNGLFFSAVNEDDVVHNHGKITGYSRLGSGNDIFDGHDGTQGKVFGEAGNDKITGGAKADVMNGGLGMDILAGGGAKDFFDYDLITDSTVGALRDLIKDFSHAQHDRIDLKDIDANALVLLDQAFTFRGQQAFSGAGQIRYVLHNKPGTANDTTSIYGNVNADLAADFQIEVKGLVHFVAGDFVL